MEMKIRLTFFLQEFEETEKAESQKKLIGIVAFVSDKFIYAVFRPKQEKHFWLVNTRSAFFYNLRLFYNLRVAVQVGY